jgi:hypothetical protein
MTASAKTRGGDLEMKRVFRFFGPWNDCKEEGWLRRMALSGWHLEKLGVFCCVFRKGAPADIVCRLDFQTETNSTGRNISESSGTPAGSMPAGAAQLTISGHRQARGVSRRSIPTRPPGSLNTGGSFSSS